MRPFSELCFQQRVQVTTTAVQGVLGQTHSYTCKPGLSGGHDQRFDGRPAICDVGQAALDQLFAREFQARLVFVSLRGDAGVHA